MVRYGPIAARSLPWQRNEAIFEIDRKTCGAANRFIVPRSASSAPEIAVSDSFRNCSRTQNSAASSLRPGSRGTPPVIAISAPQGVSPATTATPWGLGPELRDQLRPVVQQWGNLVCLGRRQADVHSRDTRSRLRFKSSRSSGAPPNVTDSERGSRPISVFDDLVLLGQERGTPDPARRQDAVAMPSRSAEHRLAMSGDIDRDMFLHGPSRDVGP